MTLENSSKPSFTMEDLPDEVLEFILDFVSPYKDLHDCLFVSKRWKRCVLNVTRVKQRNLNKAISEFDIAWQSLVPLAMAPTITKRYSHAATVYDNSMYVFGGCTCSMTTFNDLWRLDLSKRQWVRPLTMGTYPSPKACCTMVCYKDLLVLFGGWTHPAAYPLHQTWHLFNELHVYDIVGNRWNGIVTETTPPPTAGHSVSVHANWMVIFGGLQRASNVVHSTKSNDIWKLNLETWTWYKQELKDDRLKPSQRYGQSQTVLNDKNLLMMGGMGGTSVYYTDVWVLNMSGELWRWVPVEVRNMADAPPNLWCNPACKVGDRIVVLSRSRQNNTPPLMYYSKGVWIPPVGNPQTPPRNPAQVDKDENVNGRRGSFTNHKRQNSAEENRPSCSSSSESTFRNNLAMNAGGSSSGISLSAFNVAESRLPRAEQRRERRLENLRKVEEKLKKQIKDNREVCIVPSPKKQKRNVLGMYVLDISHALDDKPYVTWLPLKNNGVFTQGPEETILYSLVAGKSELIMFGGIQKDENPLCCSSNLLSNQVTNSLHFITAPKYII